jgi:anti-anti-sigma regulatory factor
MAVFVKQLVRPCEMGGSRRRVIPPAELLSHLNEMIFREGVQDTVFVTMLYALIELSKMKVTVATAGHPPLIIKRHDGRVEYLGCHCPALGIRRQSQFCQTDTKVTENDILVMYTDGITDCEDESGRVFGKEGVIRAIEAGKGSAADMYELIVKGLRECTAGQPQDDDMSLLMCGFTDERIASEDTPVASGPAVRPAACEVPRNHILYKQEGERLYFVVRGKGTWKESRPLQKSIKEAISGDISQIVIDFASCQFLDSTFLGTMQQIVTLCSEKDDLSLVVQSVPSNILESLDELVLEEVIRHIAPKPLPLPESMREIATDIVDKDEYAGHILKTHELLSQLSEKNREKFQLLLETLRKTDAPDGADANDNPPA